MSDGTSRQAQRWDDIMRRRGHELGISGRKALPYASLSRESTEDSMRPKILASGAVVFMTVLVVGLAMVGDVIAYVDAVMGVALVGCMATMFSVWWIGIRRRDASETLAREPRVIRAPEKEAMQNDRQGEQKVKTDYINRVRQSLESSPQSRSIRPAGEREESFWETPPGRAFGSPTSSLGNYTPATPDRASDFRVSPMRPSPPAHAFGSRTPYDTSPGGISAEYPSGRILHSHFSPGSMGAVMPPFSPESRGGPSRSVAGHFDMVAVERGVDALRRWIGTRLVMDISTRDSANTRAVCQLLGIPLPSTAMELRSGLSAVAHPEAASLAQERTMINRYYQLKGYPGAVEYCRHRLLELASDTCIGSYQWNAGGEWLKRPFESHGLELPTDAELIVHCFGCFFDERMPLVPSSGVLPASSSGESSGAFSSRHLAVEGELGSKSDWKLKAGGIMVRTNSRPPHFVVLGPNGRLLDVVRGRLNAFHAMIVLLTFFDREYDGYVGGIRMSDPSVDLKSVLEV